MDGGLKLPEPCPVGKHVPVIIHRSRIGGDDSKYRNVCGVCRREIERSGEADPWCTDKQVEEIVAEQMEENRREFEADMEDALHPEWRCPPRG